MSPSAPDPYTTLGVSASATDAELRAAYRRLVQLHHPDHNGGSAESARRFEEVQEAYARARQLRAGGSGASAGTAGLPRTTSGTQARRNQTAGSATHAPTGDPIEDRLRAMEHELRQEREARERDLRQAQEARERAAKAAREAAAATADDDGEGGRRATDEELGRYETDDSFAKILADVRSDVADLFGKAISVAERAAEEAAKRAADRRADHND